MQSPIATTFVILVGIIIVATIILFATPYLNKFQDYIINLLGFGGLRDMVRAINEAYHNTPDGGTNSHIEKIYLPRGTYVFTRNRDPSAGLWMACSYNIIGDYNITSPFSCVYTEIPDSVDINPGLASGGEVYITVGEGGFYKVIIFVNKNTKEISVAISS